ncbi:MAG: 23S rRNA (guanine1835-N2)-methyltransferase [Candidatus Latescibacterota bacterium]|jgi:23S rRNA (guanine1835-N2)-methyltransferase
MQTLSVPQGEFALARYPLRRRETLRAWDAADEYVLHYLHDEQLPVAGASLLVANDAFGALSTALSAQRPQLLSDSFLAHQGALENFRCNELPAENLRLLSSLDEPGERIDLLLFKVPKSLALLEDELHRLRPYLHAQTRIVGAGMSRDIHTSTLELCERIIGPTRTSLARKKARLIFCQYDAGRDSGLSPYPTSYELEGTGHLLSNHAAVFSRAQLDNGTRLLLPHISASNEPKKIADLGCGNGVIGLVAATKNPLAELFFVDESFMAVASAEANFRRVFGERKAVFTAGDGLATCAEESFDLVLNNPPFHQQRAIDESVPWRMFGQARAALKKSGQFWVVGNRHLDHHIKIKRFFGHCETVDSNGKFVVLKAVKKSCAS